MRKTVTPLALRVKFVNGDPVSLAGHSEDKGIVTGSRRTRSGRTYRVEWHGPNAVVDHYYFGDELNKITS
jgi:hypothetical protein